MLINKYDTCTYISNACYDKSMSEIDLRSLGSLTFCVFLYCSVI